MSVALQQPLFVAPADERLIDDPSRTILEAIDTRGPITAREAGEIVYRMRGYRSLMLVPRPWLTNAGGRALRRLAERQLVRRTKGNRWTRLPA